MKKKLFLLIGFVLLLSFSILAWPKNVSAQQNCSMCLTLDDCQALKPECNNCPLCCGGCIIGNGDCGTKPECTNCAICGNVTAYENSLKKFQTIEQQAKVSGQLPKESFDHSSINNILNSLNTELIGDINWPEMEKQLSLGNYQNIKIGGAIGITSNLLTTILTRPPVSSVEYFADLGKDLGIVKPAYAQGIGSSRLSNLLPLWKASRNIAYFFFVVIFIVIGLAIMLRVKIDAKTVISVQNAIPKLVVALVLVTFSYAIAGLVVDLMYLVFGIGLAAIKAAMPDVIMPTYNTSINSTFGGAVGMLSGGLTNAAFEAIGAIGPLTLAVGGGVVGFVFAGAIGGIIGGLFAQSLPIIIFTIIALVLSVRLFFKLLGIYIKIIISVITAPLQIMLSVFPGSTGGFNSWIKGLLQNVLVFPAVYLVLVMGNVLSQYAGSHWRPPMLGVSGESMVGIICMGILLSVNSVPDAVKAAFEKKAFPYGSDVGDTIKGIPGTVVGAVNTGKAVYKGGQRIVQWGKGIRAGKTGGGKETAPSAPPTPETDNTGADY